MKQVVLFIHGAGDEAYVSDTPLADSLRAALGDDYEVRYPRMMTKGSMGYDAWKETILDELASLSPDAAAPVLVGHSFGGSVLLKLLSETETIPVAGLFLVAVPFWGAPDWEVDDYTLADDFASRLPRPLPVFLYHSRDDDEVPFEHVMRYAQRLPDATLRTFDSGGHQLNDDLSAVAADIAALR